MTQVREILWFVGRQQTSESDFIFVMRARKVNNTHMAAERDVSYLH